MSTTRELADKVADAMGTADMETWTRLNAILTALERGNAEPAKCWAATGKFLAIAAAPELKSRRKPLDLQFPHTSIVLDVPYARKDEAKAAGAKWHPTRKVWIFPAYAKTVIPEIIKQFIKK